MTRSPPRFPLRRLVSAQRQLAKAAGTGNHVASAGIAAQGLLKVAILVVGEEIREELREERRLDELHV